MINIRLSRDTRMLTLEKKKEKNHIKRLYSPIYLLSHRRTLSQRSNLRKKYIYKVTQ